MSLNNNTKKAMVRKLPFPYHGAIALSNDVEFMSEAFFEGLMSFLNSTNNTPLGQGLGLEVTSSMFFYSAHPYNFSYFEGLEPQGPRTSFANRIDEYLQAGWIDTLHAYGDFDGVGGFVREHAEHTFETLARIGVTIPIYTNHGDSLNRQNIGGDAPYHQGDLSDSMAYHSDLLIRHGTRYIWTDTAVIEKVKTPLRLRQFIKQSIKRMVQSKPSRPLIENWKLQDENIMPRFMRFRSTGGNAPNLSSLAYQLEQLDLQNLYENNAITVLYQHLGVLYRSNGKCVAATLEAMKQRPENYLAPWYRLAREVKEGRLWFAGPARILDYCAMLKNVMIDANEDGSIKLKVDKPVKDPEAYFQGLTLYVEPTDDSVIYYGEKELPLVFNGPDKTGRYSVSVPFKRLENIWN